jgi:hypothetical protein
VLEEGGVQHLEGVGIEPGQVEAQQLGADVRREATNFHVP